MNMVVQGTDLAAHRDLDGNVWSYTPPGGVDFVSACLTRIVDEFFRDEGEAAADEAIGGVPIAKIYGRGQDDWSARLTWADDYEDRRTPLDVDGDGEIYVSEIERAYGEWAAMKDAGLVDMDYEDWMKTYGVGLCCRRLIVLIIIVRSFSRIIVSSRIRRTRLIRKPAFRRPLWDGVPRSSFGRLGCFLSRALSSALPVSALRFILVPKKATSRR